MIKKCTLICSDFKYCDLICSVCGCNADLRAVALGRLKIKHVKALIVALDLDSTYCLAVLLESNGIVLDQLLRGGR